MSLRSIGPHEAKRLMDEGAILVDIREADEYARETYSRRHAIWRSRSSTRPTSPPITAAP